MAREPMVTRTIKTTVVSALCLNIETAEPHTETFTMPRRYKDEATLLSKVKAKYDTDNVKVVSLVEVHEQETLYGMTEIDFVKSAQVLSPRTAKKESTK